MTAAKNMFPLQILLATYNSTQYLRQQLDSLFLQDFQDFQLLIRDGGSQDDTVEIIREYQEKYPERIDFLGSWKVRALENFSELLKISDAELVMFCDHDDVWLPQKISHTLAKYREVEAEYGTPTPLLVFTDSCVADRNLHVIASSMLQYQHLDISRLSLNQLLLQNVPSGNAMLLNRALVDLALPVSPDAVIHDHWIALVAAAFGKIAFLNESTLLYRQHGENVYGASHYSVAGMLRKVQAGRGKVVERFEENIRQAAAFGKRYGEKLSPREQEMFAALAHWNEYGFLQRRRILLKYRILKSGFLRNLGMFIFL